MELVVLFETRKRSRQSRPFKVLISISLSSKIRFIPPGKTSVFIHTLSLLLWVPIYLRLYDRIHTNSFPPSKTPPIISQNGSHTKTNPLPFRTKRIPFFNFQTHFPRTHSHSERNGSHSERNGHGKREKLRTKRN